MNVYKHELKQNIKSLYTWAPVLVGITIFFMLFYPTFKSDIDAFNKMMENYPEALKAAFGLAVLDISSAGGFYAFVFIYTILFATIQAANLGVSVFSKEVRDKTADFLLTKPVSRRKILTNKIFACLSILIGTNFIYNLIVVSYMYFLYGNEIELKGIMLVNLSLFLMQLIFYSIGMAVAVLLKKIRAVLPISLGIVFIFYILNTIVLIGKENGLLKYLTPFQYFVPSEIQNSNKFEIKYVIATFIIIVVCILSTYVVYSKKDIRG